MYQNVNSDYFENNDSFQENKINLLLKELFKPRNCIIYIITFLISIVKIRNTILPFGLSIISACLGSTIPIFIIYIVSCISTLILYGGSVFLDFFLTSLILFLIIFFFKPKISMEEKNEVFKVGTRLFFATFIYNLVKNINGCLTISNIYLYFIISCIIYVFYKVFVNGIVVIKDYNIKNAFTAEEIISMVIIISISFFAFKDILIFGYNLNIILNFVFIIFIGFQNGIFIGGLSGLIVGLTFGLIDNLNFFQIIVFSMTGVVSGIFSFLILPDKFRRTKKKNEEKLLNNLGEHRLSYYEEIKEKLNAVAQTISDMRNSFLIKNNENSDDELLKKEVYIDNFLNMLENYSSNIFYEDLIKNENIIGDFFDILLKDDVITEKATIEIFEKYNNYILLRDQKLKDDLQEIIKISNRTYKELQINYLKVKIKKEEAEKLEKELDNISSTINNISKNSKNNYELEEREIFALLNGKMYPIKNVNVNKYKNGKAIVILNFEFKDFLKDKTRITNIQAILTRVLGTKIVFDREKKDLESGIYNQIYLAEDKYSLQLGSCKISKGNRNVSGDSNLQLRLKDGKYLLAISDGMGSGENAKKASRFVINCLNKLLSNGFDKDETLKLINSELIFNKNSEMYATADISILDLYNGNIIMSKNCACNTYIKTRKCVNVYKGNSLPIGIVENAEINCQEVKLNDGDIILMCSDGIFENAYDKKKDWVEDFLKNVNTNNVQKIADLIVGEAIDNSFGIPKDDITVIVGKVIKK